MHSHTDSPSSASTGGTSAGSCCGGKGGCGSGSRHADAIAGDASTGSVGIVSAFDIPMPSLEQIASLDVHELIHRYRLGIENFDRRIFWLDEAQLDTAFLPDAGVGRWPARVLVGHLADAELATVHRIRRAVAEENPLVALWDENAFVDSGLYGRASAARREGEGAEAGGMPSAAFPLAGFVAVIHTLRRWLAEWLMTLTPAQWDRRILHPERGEITVRRLVAMTTWHLEHHAWYLNAKVEKMLGVDTGEEPAMSPSSGGCCGGGGCKG
jgi:DinB superfamily